MQEWEQWKMKPRKVERQDYSDSDKHIVEREMNENEND